MIIKIARLSTVALLAISSATLAARKPNIVLILTDDLGYGDVSFLNPESKVQTPHMDALARAGVWATDAHAPSTVCSPSRYSILTGRYAWRGSLRAGRLKPVERIRHRRGSCHATEGAEC